jgi:nickel-dependent lactate racemase
MITFPGGLSGVKHPFILASRDADMTTAKTAESTLAGAAHIGGPGETLDPVRVREFLAGALEPVRLDGRGLCVLVPDATRSCPLPLLLSAVHSAVWGRVSRFTVLIALGTHSPMTPRSIEAHLGGSYPGATVINHQWWDDAALATVGSITRQRVEELSGGLLSQGVDVRINRAVLEHDLTLILGPVFPHEVVGFSGGNKYLFPGVSGRELIDVSHWLGALITSAEIIGRLGVTPVRALFDDAASMVPGSRLAVCVVTGPSGSLRSVSFGPPEEAWARAAEVSAEAHIRYLDKPAARVLSILPRRYDDMWTGAKGFYKVEPVVAEGGQAVIYAPHITELSATHPEILEIGYHCRDYFVKQWDRFRGRHWGDLAHSTHLKGAGTYDPEAGEHSRVRVTLATGIPEDVVRAVNLDYLDPGDVDPEEWGRDPATLIVLDAGEDLYRLRPAR